MSHSRQEQGQSDYWRAGRGSVVRNGCVCDTRHHPPYTPTYSIQTRDRNWVVTESLHFYHRLGIPTFRSVRLNRGRVIAPLFFLHQKHLGHQGDRCTEGHTDRVRVVHLEPSTPFLPFHSHGAPRVFCSLQCRLDTCLASSSTYSSLVSVGTELPRNKSKKNWESVPGSYVYPEQQWKSEYRKIPIYEVEQCTSGISQTHPKTSSLVNEHKRTDLGPVTTFHSLKQTETH